MSEYVFCRSQLAGHCRPGTLDDLLRAQREADAALGPVDMTPTPKPTSPRKGGARGKMGNLIAKLKAQGRIAHA